jgi:hypothetical protein
MASPSTLDLSVQHVQDILNHSMQIDRLVREHQSIARNARDSIG